MTSFFDAEFFAANRRKLTENIGTTAPIVITAHGLLQRNGDAAFSFRQDSSFWYLTGVDEPDITLVIDADKEYLIVPDRSDVREFFDGPLVRDALADRSGITDIIGNKQGWERLGQRLKHVKQVATLLPNQEYIEHDGLYSNPARKKLVEQIKAFGSKLEFVDIRPDIMKLRAVKQPGEIAALRHAIDITADSFVLLEKKLPSLRFEYEAEALITHGFRSKGAVHGYGPIVASGKNACTLHYISNNGKIQPNQLLLIDVGAEVENYSADITRTLVCGEPTKRQRQVIVAVAESLDYGISLLKPGISIAEFHKKTEQHIGRQLKNLGLIDIMDKAHIRRYYPHAISHFLGLDVHDVGDYQAPLSPGMVITVEPGIYIPEEGIGVRIEDNVLITEDGCEVLSANLPKMLGVA